MPPRSSLTSSFSVSDANNEVVCPLTNPDNSNCRKRCIGEKRYRSMQEHIRRAHPDHYIPKLPATEESFLLMIHTPPSAKPPQPPQPPKTSPSSRDGDEKVTPTSAPRRTESQQKAAAALTALQNHLNSSEWEGDQDHDVGLDNKKEPPHSSIELPSLRDQFGKEGLPPFHSGRQRELLPAFLDQSPPGRSSTLPPIQRPGAKHRARKQSVGQNARRPKHERTKSREYARRLSIDGRKAMSAEPQTAAWVQGKRWEDLIEAATSATEADYDRDLTPMAQSPLFPQITSAAGSQVQRSSLPPGFASGPHRHFQPAGYAASPLTRALTPPPLDVEPEIDPEPFPSVESSGDSSVSGRNFHMSASGLTNASNSVSDISPVQTHAQTYRGKDIKIYCSGCSRPWLIRDCYACTECICGVCRECVTPLLTGMHNNNSINRFSYPMANGRKGCPRCGAVDGKWKPFKLEFHHGSISHGSRASHGSFSAGSF